MGDPANTPVVNSFNEWDPLEEVIVGNLEGLAWPKHEQMFFRSVIPFDPEELNDVAGKPRSVTEIAKRQLEEFVNVLKGEGVKVRRPEPIDNARPYSTPDWQSPGGYLQSVPRDLLIVIGNEILEATGSWHCRFFEYRAYRPLVKEYFRAGAKWTQAPRPELTPESYEKRVRTREETYEYYAVSDHEPLFDAADIARVGKDLFVQLSNLTNRSGIEWLRRHFAGQYNVHLLEFRDPYAAHIDATWVPLAPGKLLVNPDRPLNTKTTPLPAGFKNWEIFTAPFTVRPESDPFYKMFKWLHMNNLMLDERRIIVEKAEEPLIRSLKDWGFEPIPVNFRECWGYGGSFHCFTCDVRRRGTLKSYL